MSTNDIIVVKEADASWNDQDYLFAFSQYGYLKPYQIHSGSGTTIFYGTGRNTRRLNNYQMILKTQAKDIEENSLDWLYSLGMSYRPTGGTADFNNYLKYLFSVNDDYTALLMKFLRF